MLSTATDWTDAAAKCRMQAEHLRDSGTSRQRMTRRRLSIVESQRREADKLDELARAMDAMSAGIATGNLVAQLQAVRDRATLECLLGHRWDGKEDRLCRAGLDDESSREMCLAYFRAFDATAPVDEDKARRDRVAQMERELFGEKIPGFFPTPPSVIKLMLQCADMGPDVANIFEPSAGKGDLLEAAREEAKRVGAWPDYAWCEINSRLRDIVIARGFGAYMVNDDFMKLASGGRTGQGDYDLVLMNPPFENGQDIKHVLIAASLLNSTGRLVAIMSAGPFFRKDADSVMFRDWLEKKGAWYQRLPEGAFNGNDAFRATGVRCYIVVVDAAGPARDSDPLEVEYEIV